jgi:hypothetical protein
MKLNVAAFAAAAGIFWTLAVLTIATANLVWPPYGRAFLDLLASMYPGYHPGAGPGSVLVATLYGLVDGVASGALIAWLYNLAAQRVAKAAS